MDIAVLAHESFPDRAKTAVGLLRYGDHEVRALIDHDNAGGRVNDLLADVQDAPIVASMDEVPDVDALVIGIAPIGGDFDESWRPDVRTALERGCHVLSGLNYFLADDEEFARLAEEHDGQLADLRKPPDNLTVADGTAGDVDARVVTTVGTDCSTGKMTAAFALREAARERGLDAAVAPTGQTGIMIADRDDDTVRPVPPLFRGQDVQHPGSPCFIGIVSPVVFIVRMHCQGQAVHVVHPFDIRFHI
jgi:uncharacterized NAD-dependent epimerase/dehydratase family protein